MKRFGSVELGALILSLLFIVVGIGSLIHPSSYYVMHPTNDVIGAPEAYLEHVTPEGARVYAVLSLVVGLGLALFVVFPRRK
jgi:hypothetical protein